jgi:hypothetical protein
VLAIADIGQPLSMAEDDDRKRGLTLEKLRQQREDLRSRLQPVEQTLDAFRATIRAA